MNGEIPSVPITTLAGIASLTDLLPEMPLPSPLPQTLSNKSLLFHPRVAEEAQRLLAGRDDALVPQLLHALVHTSADHIELKDHYAGSEPPTEQLQQNVPELLRAILQCNPDVFKGPQVNSPYQTQWPVNETSQFSSSPQSCSPGSSNSKMDHILAHAPIAVDVNCATSLTESESKLAVKEEVLCSDKGSAFLENGGVVVSELESSVTRSSKVDVVCERLLQDAACEQEKLSLVTSSTPNSVLTVVAHPNQSCGASGVTLSDNLSAESNQPLVKEELEKVPSQEEELNSLCKKSTPDFCNIKEPVVMLNKISAEDQALMQRSLSAFAAKCPTLASKLGITANHRTPEKSKYCELSSESESEEQFQRNRSRIFLARSKEREMQRKKEKEEKKRKRKISSGDDDEYTPDIIGDYETSLSERIKKRKRVCQNLKTGDPAEDNIFMNDDSLHSSPKRKIRKVERKLVPVLEKLSVEELMETNTYQRFNRSIEMIFDNTEDLDLNAESDEYAEVPPEALIPKYQLQELCSEAAKLKTLGAMESIPTDRLARLLNILEKNIRDGTRVSPVADPDDDEEESKLWLELTMERVLRAIDASLTALYILTSSNMPKRLYLEEVIDRIVQFTKYQLQHTIFPSFDPVYRVITKAKDGFAGNLKKKRGHAKEVREKSLLGLYNKLHEVVALLAELLNIQVLTDTAVLHVSTLGVAPFFVENVSELQLSSLKLVTTVFTKYEKHRRLLLDDILASIARLPSSKRSLRTYRLSSEEYIQMLTALVLQLIQCVVVLPDWLVSLGSADASVKEEHVPVDEKEHNNIDNRDRLANVDRDVLIVNKYETATRTAGNFLSVFLNKCGNKNEEIDYRPLFENFVQDLLTTVNKPEWPAAELLLSLLGKLLVQNFVNKSTDMSLRVASLDYLGVVAARLRKDAVSSQLKLDTIDRIIKEIKDEEQKESDDASTVKRKKKIRDRVNSVDLGPDEARMQFLQRVLLDYLAVNGQSDPALMYARHFYIAQWYRDAATEINRPTSHSSKSSQVNSKTKRARGRRRKGSSSGEDEQSDLSDLEDIEDARIRKQSNEQKNAEQFRVIESRKCFLVTKVRPFSDAVMTSNKTQVLQTYIDYGSAELISRYLASKRPFSQSFDAYLKQILRVLTENSIAIRTKAMKCLTLVVEADPAVLGRTDMQLGVHHSFLDHSTAVREAAVDLVGKFVLSRPELIDKYYDMLSARILDTGVSVRKRVIKILKDICIECPEFPKIPEICVKMIRRVNDEEGIRKLVMEVFQNMWFTPVREQPQLDSSTLLRKVMNITDVVAACRDTGLDWFEQLLLSLFKPKEDKDDSTKVYAEPPRALVTACSQIVDCLVENVLRLEEMGGKGGEKIYQKQEAKCNGTSNNEIGPVECDDLDGSGGIVNGSGASSGGPSQRLVACLKTLYLFAKIRPQLLVEHAITLQPYLSLKCQTPGDFQLVNSVALTLELVVPLMEHPSETFLAQLEEDATKLILVHEKTVVASCLSCLGSVVNNVTHNYRLIRDCFRKYYGCLTNYRALYEKDPNHPSLLQCQPYFRRALFTVGQLFRHFDFAKEEVRDDLMDDIKERVFEILVYFVQNLNQDLQAFTLEAIGSFCIRHYEYMLETDLKELYHHLLTNETAPLRHRTQVLQNIETYLQEEELRMIKQDQEWAKLSKKENLKEMGDVSSGMASTVIQLYLKQILESFLHPSIAVRHAALKVIQLILQQGLVHPVQIVPYLICMSTDETQMVSHSADRQLQDIEKKYPGFIHMKAQSGIRLSYKLQRILQPDLPVRGFREKEGEPPSALNGFLYSILRSTRQQRRAVALAVLRQFDEQNKINLAQLLYLADNLAYFPYQVQDEPLFIIHHIDIIISVSGSNLLQAFREALLPPAHAEMRPNPETGQLEVVYDEEEDEDLDALLSRLPTDTVVLQEYMAASQGCLLLLVLKEHLKDIYGISDAKIAQYSPSESAKVYEKSLNRKSHVKFDPRVTIGKLRMEPSNPILDTDGQKALLEQYLDFKQLMLKFDPEDPDEEDIKPVLKAANEGDNVCQTPVDSITVNMNEDGKQEPPPKIPKVTIVPPRPPDTKENKSHRPHRLHKTERHRRHKHKKKRRRQQSEDDDSENEMSDPDFLA